MLMATTPPGMRRPSGLGNCARTVTVSVVGAYYYLRVVKLMYFDDPTSTPPAAAREPGVRFALGLNAAAALALGLLPGPLLDLCARLIH